eukprot:TRINITY_DN2159_c0_g1_i1.p1 TRINITY_DN2159_c0_g1~~TRINITY_DN2159_c0_g1_i1.p1  ORF type:complete len:445 (-),score=78.67 TRINITY_DN2159_c0_g1_i1:88-1422(-)
MVIGIVHNGAYVRSLQWCPKGYEYCNKKATSDSSDNGSSNGDKPIPRLGVLAVATGDGELKLYAVPNPDFLEKNLEPRSFPYIFELSPLVIYKNVDKLNLIHSIDWSPNNPNLILTGSTNGHVCVWKVTDDPDSIVYTPSPLVTSDVGDSIVRKESLICTNPIWNRPVHTFCVSSVKWCKTYPSFFVTCGFDGQIIVWDMYDSSIPLYTNGHLKGGFLTTVLWVDGHYKKIVVGTDSGTIAHVGPSNTYRVKSQKINYFDYNTSQIWGLDATDTNHEIVSVSSEGRVSSFHANPVLNKLKGAERFPEVEIDQIGYDEESKTLTFRDLYDYPSLYQQEDSTKKEKKKTKVLKNILSSNLAVHRVKWNPNLNASHWLIYGGKTGLLRCQCIDWIMARKEDVNAEPTKSARGRPKKDSTTVDSTKKRGRPKNESTTEPPKKKAKTDK